MTKVRISEKDKVAKSGKDVAKTENRFYCRIYPKRKPTESKLPVRKNKN
ncbi:hypothetical protein SAMN05421664_3708 [Chryseobacterium soldanellicola]|uniref:Uncharacterized protein n=1 Tax=Chryseobacterium soldanellicola TaxID=311333 RepID=A0A1H1GJ21_9FLAO|nr:hypothetical protein SAMN05421664_3708 [Chryseobacterium soldanellicola]